MGTTLLHTTFVYFREGVFYKLRNLMRASSDDFYGYMTFLERSAEIRAFYDIDKRLCAEDTQFVIISLGVSHIRLHLRIMAGTLNLRISVAFGQCCLYHCAFY